MTGVITVDGAAVIRQDNMRGCQLHDGQGTVWQVPKVYRWLFVMQHREPGRRELKIRFYEIGQN